MITPFLTLSSPDEALALWLGQVGSTISAELCPLDRAIGRISAQTIYTPFPLPRFPRSTVDGYAVIARDTFGSSDSLPAYLQLIGEVVMGATPSFSLQSGQCALIHTGGMLPANANAVVMIEHTEGRLAQEVEVVRSVAVGENCLQVGEEMAEGEIALEKGCKVRSAELGTLAACGISHLAVAKPPRIAILSTGDELVSLGQPLTQLAQLYDVNTHSLAGLITEHGGIPVPYPLLPDDPQKVRQSAEHALAHCDLLIFSAGSSISTRDHTAQLIAQLGEPGILVHGLQIKPGKPTLLAVCQGKPIIGLPGNPLSAWIVAWRFVVPALNQLLAHQPRPHPPLCATLTTNLPSQAGREDWVLVRLKQEGRGWSAEPLFGKSNFITTLSRADGLLCIPPAVTGFPAQSTVPILLL